MKRTDVENLPVRTVTGLARLAVVFGDILRKFSTQTATEAAFLTQLDDLMADGYSDGLGARARGLHD